MNSIVRTGVGIVTTSLALSVLLACGGASEGNDGLGQPGAEKTASTAQAVMSCEAPIEGYINYLGQSNQNYIFAEVSAPAFGVTHGFVLEYRTVEYTPRLCFRGVCWGPYVNYTGINGSNGSDSLSVDIEGDFTITVGGTSISNVQVTAIACTENANSTTTLLGTDSSGNAITVTLKQEFIYG
jgi:hypothetical protein